MAKSDNQVDPNETLLKHFLKYVEENSITFAPAKNLLTTLIDSLNLVSKFNFILKFEVFDSILYLFAKTGG